VTDAVDDFLDGTFGRLSLSCETCRSLPRPSETELEDEAVRVVSAVSAVLAPDDATAIGGAAAPGAGAPSVFTPGTGDACEK